MTSFKPCSDFGLAPSLVAKLEWLHSNNVFGLGLLALSQLFLFTFQVL